MAVRLSALFLILNEERDILTADENFVMTMPGATQLTLMFSDARSLAAALVSPSNAVLLTEYTPSSCKHKCHYRKLVQKGKT
jgi:hypothetical protein